MKRRSALWFSSGAPVSSLNWKEATVVEAPPLIDSTVLAAANVNKTYQCNLLTTSLSNKRCIKLKVIELWSILAHIRYLIYRNNSFTVGNAFYTRKNTQLLANHQFAASLLTKCCSLTVMQTMSTLSQSCYNRTVSTPLQVVTSLLTSC